MTIPHFHFRQPNRRKATMKFFAFFLVLQKVLLTSATKENMTDIENSNFTDYAECDFNFTFGYTEETLGSTQDMPLMQYHDVSNLRVYKGPLPKFPGSTTSPWIALHSPVKMYIPIRNTGKVSADSENCIQCPRNLIVYLSSHQRYILAPVPSITICSRGPLHPDRMKVYLAFLDQAYFHPIAFHPLVSNSFASRSGRVHVAVISGPRPAERLYPGRHQVELMVWKADGPVHSCKYTISVKRRRRVSIPVPPKNLPCPQPESPSDGVLLCDGGIKKTYPHDSICQIFCPPNYLVQNTSRSSSTIICKNGHWTPKGQVTCIAEFCPDLPHISEHSFWNCNVEDATKRFSNGTRCKVNCAPDYVIPSSQLENDAIACRPPTWNNVETIPVCRRAYLPKLQLCQNRHLFVKPGHFAKITPFMLPKGSSHTGESLSPVCTLKEKSLPKGKHENICEVTDPELRTTQKCTYSIIIKENSGPQPHPGDCKNRTILISGRNSIHLKPVRFLKKFGKPVRNKVLRGSCKPKGDVGVGHHFVVCTVTDPQTKITATCSYWLNIQKRTCPPMKRIPNGQVICPSREVGSVCHYKCDSGYTFVGNDSTKATKVCRSNRKWQPYLNPVCETESSTIIEGCENLEVHVSSEMPYEVPLPKFLTHLNETLNVSCSPLIIKTAGVHQVLCEAYDDVFNVSCQFNVSVLLKDKFVASANNMHLKGKFPKLIDVCEKLEINFSASVHYTVSPISNEMMNFSCVPDLSAEAEQHLIICTTDNDEISISCHVNDSNDFEDETLSLSFPVTGELPKLIHGCENLEVNVSTPIHYITPLPQYLTSSNETLNVSCIPKLLATAGQHHIVCTTAMGKFNISCHFDVSIQIEDGSLLSSLPPPKDPALQLVSGCSSITVNVSIPVNFSTPQPKYLSSLNDTILGVCTPSFMNYIGNHVVNCTVNNNVNNSTSSCQFNVTIISEDESRELKSIEKVSCTPLVPPLHGSIDCNFKDRTEICLVACDPGFGFPEEDFLSLVCNSNPEGIWNAENFDFNGTLPTCFPQLEGSAVEVWMSFEAFAPHCGEDFQSQVEDLVSEMCVEGANCSNVSVNCTLDEESDLMLVVVNWTVQADFIDEEHYDDEEIPEAEIRLEAVMENTRKFLASEQIPDGVELFRDSFRKGFITLVCPDGFISNTLMSKCIQCLKGSKIC